MSTFRKKSTSTETSTSSSSESGSSTSSSCSGSSSSDSESSTSADEKSAKGNEGNANRITRRKSSEFKAAAKADTEKHTPVQSSSVKSRPTNGATAQRQPLRSNTISSEDDGAPPHKKPVRSTSIVTGIQRRKIPSINGAAPQTQSQKSVGGKAPPASARLTQTALAKTTSTKQNSAQADSAENNSRKEQSKSVLSVLTDESDKELPPSRGKLERKVQPKAGTTSHSAVVAAAARPKQSKSKPQPKRSTSSKVQTAQQKSSEDSETESGSSSSESEASDSSNSYTSHPTKAIKGKRSSTAGKIRRFDSDNDDGGGISVPVTARKLTRSLSTRRNKQQLKHGAGAATDSDSDMAELDMEKRSLSKSPAKKAVIGGSSKCKVKKESGNMGSGGNGSMGTMQPKPPSLSPPQQIEKKCPIEGCDSSGHLCGNLDKHFLSEACPIYHNMSASECKERANERKIGDEHHQKAGNKSATTAAINNDLAAGNSRNLTSEQKDFLTKIRESRQRFHPIAAAISPDKVKMEKDCTDEDREPSLAGLVPDYDLQLFREAQAIASERIEDELKDLPVGKGIKYITMGKYKMKVWYQSPYPDDAARLPKMYICEFCLRYQKSETGIKRHAQKCVWRHPPGDEIYRKGKLQVWQVDGKRHKQYCQHLCLLAKFFLDHKTLYYDVEPFLFYIMTLADVDGCHTVGYFSKEKNSFYNVSCILTLPPYQRKGYGRLLIDFSYLLTRVEGKIGSPEKPLSDLGLISYRSYWKDVLLDYLCNRTGNTLSIKDVSQEMAIYSYDIVSTLQALGMMKYWKGKHIVLKKQDVLDEYEERVKRRGNFPKIDDSCLRWSPFVPTQKTDSP